MCLFAHSLQTLHIFISGQMLVIKASVTPNPLIYAEGRLQQTPQLTVFQLYCQEECERMFEYSDGVEASSVIQIKVAVRKLRKMSCIKLLDLWI